VRPLVKTPDAVFDPIRQRSELSFLEAAPAVDNSGRGFNERAGELPRGSGFIARCLIAWPDSTQGQRSCRPAPEVLPAVDAFNARLRALLDTPLAMDAQGGLSPTMPELSHEARAA
jgi:putative DNA primase/helicase